MIESRRDRERGSATIWVITACALIVAVSVLVIVGGGATVARHRAQATADLAALAAATRIGVGGDPCLAAADVARANGAQLEACTTVQSVDGRTGSVRVAIRWPFTLVLAGRWNAHGRSAAARLPFDADPSRPAP